MGSRITGLELACAAHYVHILSPKPAVGSDVGNSGLVLPPGRNKCAATKLREKSKDLDHE
jgi:hypothetical protein